MLENLKFPDKTEEQWSGVFGGNKNFDESFDSTRVIVDPAGYDGTLSTQLGNRSFTIEGISSDAAEWGDLVDELGMTVESSEADAVELKEPEPLRVELKEDIGENAASSVNADGMKASGPSPMQRFMQATSRHFTKFAQQFQQRHEYACTQLPPRPQQAPRGLKADALKQPFQTFEQKVHNKCLLASSNLAPKSSWRKQSDQIINLDFEESDGSQGVGSVRYYTCRKCHTR
ncbi:hypothetical protein KGF57_000666 [Candida theae]|uniref:Uncharacterized protein n=1 Tax=Candida theae TaxID=1198502 RepID=A0AAD5BIH7_9ASCO|nr:uncharacterized protein KGF57_000666 [Candida theae]KAI5966030.1 hypothetical protein KGF57_000666 [Candida theae]